MPIYDYECQKCRRVFELIEKRADRDNYHQCPDCLGGEVKPLLGVCGWVLNGDGWYRSNHGGTKGD